MSLLRCAAIACGLLGLAACASQIDEVSPSFETLQILREQAVPPVAVGQFAPGSKNLGRSVTIRLSVMHAQKGRDFAAFLGNAFETDLRAAGKLDPASALRIEGILTESHLAEDLGKGRASLGATITLRRNGAVVFAKPYRVESSWPSDFIGAIAIPEAFRQYNALYSMLVKQTLSDPEFVKAAKGK